ncbi:MAG: phosphate signaling complex protein PhoU [Anaerolineales bacterium]|nr:phosphate signaling complex protein PhoU [Anaerolineales bacterium]
MNKGLRGEYDRQYALVQDAILRMGGMVDRAIEEAILSLQNRDQTLAEELILRDAEVNILRFQIEESCLALIATQQPAASDLRAVIAAMNIVVDMERMGDHAAGIAKTVIRMGDQPLLKPLIDIPKMAELSRRMLEDSLKAFVEHDEKLARSIAKYDDDMDSYYQLIFNELVGIMAARPEAVERATYLLWCAHNLERIGDRVTNIAERVIFVNTGDMRELNLPH